MNLYVLRSKDGKFFRSKGRDGYGDSWVDELEKAKFYTRIGTAKAQVSYWYGRYPKFGCPDLLEFTLIPAAATVIDMLQSTEKAAQKRQAAHAKKVENFRKWNLEQAQRDLVRATDRVNSFRR